MFSIRASLRMVGALVVVSGAVAACASDPVDAETETETETATVVLGTCQYVNVFSGGEECREYEGEDWTEETLSVACDDLMGSAAIGARCTTDEMLGRCTLEADYGQVVVFAYGTDAGSCDGQVLGCETFGGGEWSPEPICGGGGSGGGDGGVFIQPTLECRDPVAGEPAGNGPNGQVCTWQAISGCTEEGRHFEDYASCDVVRTQRPYYAAPPSPGSDEPDPRLDDPVYAAELDWVRSQVQASACVCCHSEASPNGPSNWSIDAPNNWINTFADSGLALGANYVTSISFGAYPPEDNNGFERETSGFPSTEPERMRAFFIAELAYRGLDAGDFADTPPFGGPIHDQLLYEPSACENGEGVGQDGTLVWEGGDARYVYVLDQGSANPTVPPNLDLPDGVRWRIDVPADGSPIESGTMTYGTVPDGTTQRFPPAGSASTLVAGNTYYLYVTRDVGIPLTRCLFTAP